MSVHSKKDLIVGNSYYLAIVEGEKYAEKVKLEKIEHPVKVLFSVKIKQTCIRVVNEKKQAMCFDIRQIGIGETKKEANTNFLTL